MTFDITNYAIQYCPIHNIYIVYLITNKTMNETQCWECTRDTNKKGTKR